MKKIKAKKSPNKLRRGASEAKALHDARTEGEDTNSVLTPTSWDELDTDGKVERMREVVKHLMERLDTRENEIQRLRQILYKHSHGPTGEAVVPVYESDRSSFPQSIGSGRVGNSENVWF